MIDELLLCVTGVAVMIAARSQAAVAATRRSVQRREELRRYGLSLDTSETRLQGTVEGLPLAVSLPRAIGERFVVAVSLPPPRAEPAGERRRSLPAPSGWTLHETADGVRLEEEPRFFPDPRLYTATQILTACERALDAARDVMSRRGYR